MNRKTVIFVIATVAALAASSCVKIDQDPIVRDSISFAPVAARSTKAGIINGNEYPTDTPFTVSAFYQGTQAYFENLTASHSGSYWVTSTPEYWPLEGTLTFFSYSPASASGVTIDATNGITATGYTIQNSTQMETDLCYASTTAIDCVTHPDEVPLHFSHALSQVVFRVKAAGYYSTATNDVALAVTSLSLNGINSVGDFANGTWRNQNTSRDYSISNTATALTYDNQHTPEVTVLASYLFIPQELGANAALSVGYRIVQRNGGQDYILTNPPVSIPLYGGTITQWEPGKKYIYTLTIGMNNVITFTANAVGWQDRSDSIIVEEN